MEVAQVLLSFFHFLWNIKVYFLHSLLRITYPVKFTTSFFFNTNGIEQNSTKVPVHLSLIINENDVSYSDLARLLVWCMNSGIFYITLYDINGK